ncbi:hypothetical protein ACS0TY_033890 [Phlomoides rotata]
MESSTSIGKSNQRRKRCCYYGIALSSIRPAEFYRYLAHNAGGEDRVGHTMKDHKKFVNHEKMKNIEGGNAKTFMELIQKQEDEETNFFYKVQMNEEERLLNIFWRDSMMQEDFGIYGDVVKSMGGRSPVTIFTDQDLAITKAIEKIFPETRHRLCICHLHQNAVSRFADLKCDDTFKGNFNICLTGCKDKEKHSFPVLAERNGFGQRIFLHTGARLFGGLFGASRLHFSKQVGSIWRVSFVTTIWALWHAYNKFIFDGLRPTVRGMVTFVLAVVREAGCLIKVHWCPPHAGWYKANVDGSVSSAPGCMHVGVLFRNSRGFFVGAFYTRTGQGYPMEAELAAILHLILYAHSQGWHSLWVESNSTLAIDTVLRKISLVPWRLQGL